MTLAEQYRQEGREQGEEKGRLQGQLIGKIQLLQDLLGHITTPAETLALRSMNELEALHDALKAELR